MLHRTVPSPTLFRRTVGLLATCLRRARGIATEHDSSSDLLGDVVLRPVVCQSCRNGKLIVLCRLMHEDLSNKHDSCLSVPIDYCV
jgi:hypothetical protein